MFNHFYSLLRNKKPDTEDVILIPQQFKKVTLTPVLKNIDELLFGRNTSIVYKNAVAHILMSTIKATPYADRIFSRYDDRYSYDLTSIRDYFSVTRNLVIDDSGISAKVFGSYKTDIRKGRVSDTIIIKSTGTSNEVTVYSAKNYFSAKTETLSFTNGISNLVKVANTGISFLIDTGGLTFSDAARTLKIEVSGPISIDSAALLSTITSRTDLTLPVLKQPRATDDDTFYYLFNQHYNMVYKTAGLLAEYVDRIQYLYEGNN